MIRSVFVKSLWLVTFVALAASSGSVFAEEEQVTASKVNWRDYFPTAYSGISLRHYNEVVDGAENPTPFMQLRAAIGAKFLDDKLDTSLTLGLNKMYESDEFSQGRTFSQRSPRLLATYSMFESDMLSFTPRVGAKLPLYGNNQLQLEVGGELASSHNMDMLAGKVSLGGLADVYAVQHVGRNETSVSVDDEAKRERIREAYGLTASEEGDNLTIKEDYARYGSAYSLWASYAPEMIDGLALTVSTTYAISYEPQWKAADGENSEAIQLSGYEASSGVENGFGLSYKINDEISISNTLYYYLDGFYASKTAPGETRLINLAKISYDLF